MKTNIDSSMQHILKNHHIHCTMTTVFRICIFTISNEKPAIWVICSCGQKHCRKHTNQTCLLEGQDFIFIIIKTDGIQSRCVLCTTDIK